MLVIGFERDDTPFSIGRFHEIGESLQEFLGISVDQHIVAGEIRFTFHRVDDDDIDRRFGLIFDVRRESRAAQSGQTGLLHSFDQFGSGEDQRIRFGTNGDIHPVRLIILDFNGIDHPAGCMPNFFDGGHFPADGSVNRHRAESFS